MPTEPVLSPYEQWRLLLWMEAHPAALEHKPATGCSQRHDAWGHNACGPRRVPLAYALGVAVGTLWRAFKRWW